MNSEELRQFLETRQNSMSDQQFFALIFDMLENGSSQESREILETHLITYSHVDENRVARYLEQFLSDPDPHRIKFAILELITLARTPDSLAEKILVKFSEDGSTQIEKGRISEKPSLGEETKIEQLEQYLESRRKNLTDKDFFEMVLGMLENDLTGDTQDVLKRYLLAYSFVDKDRVARYLEQFLSDPDPIQREFAALDLAHLIRGPDSLAYKILTDYLGEEPTEDKKTKIMMERFIDLFPRQDREE